MEVSVIIPLFNSADYVERAVLSALAEEQVHEVIIIDDASTDHGMDICLNLAKKYSKVKIFSHIDLLNHGAGASRRLGVERASMDYICFLDADDFFLPGRFKKAKEILSSNCNADGVYEAMGFSFDSKFKTDEFNSYFGFNAKLTTVTEKLSPEDLFFKQAPIGNSGYCPVGGWVIRRSLFSITDFFSEISMHEDTVMFVKLASKGRFYPGYLDRAVVMRGVHQGNRITKKRSDFENFYNRLLMWKEIWNWGLDELNLKQKQVVAENMIFHMLSVRNHYKNFKYLRMVFFSFKFLRDNPSLQISLFLVRWMEKIKLKLSSKLRRLRWFS